MASKIDRFETEPTPEIEEELRQAKIADGMAGVVMRLHAEARDRVQKRRQIEIRWIQDMRLYYGRYDEVTEKGLEASNGQKSRAFIPLARTKTNLWEAELNDRLFPADDRNWGISPTPVPDLANEAERAKQEAIEAEAEAERLKEQQRTQAEAQAVAGEGSEPMPAPEGGDDLEAMAQVAAGHAQDQRDIERLVRQQMAVATKRAQAMEQEMDDQLTECVYPKRSRDVISDACRLGVGVMKGPMFASKPRRAWEQVDENVYALKDIKQDKPQFYRVDPWNFFPDPNAQDMEFSESELERHLPNKRQLRKMARELDFNQKAVRELLTEGPGHGSTDDLQFITYIRNITNEGEAVTGRYVVWEYHGALECDEVCDLLRSLGKEQEADRFQEEHDPIEETRVIVHFCNGKLLRLAEAYILDSGESLYSVFPFEKSEGSIMGAVGVPNLMGDALRALNAAWRMMIDNAALSVGPQVVVDKNLIEPEDGDWRLTGRKVWQRTGAGDVVNKEQKPFETFDIPLNQAQLAGIIELALKFIDDVTGLTIPGQNDDSVPAAQTVGGMAMQQNAIGVIFRRVVKNWDDDLTTPVIRRLYDWNMQFSDKAEIKGDMKVEARGTSALLVKELQSQHLSNIVQNWTVHPVLGVALKAYDAMRMALQSLSINADDLLITREDFEQKLQDMAQAQPSPEQIRAEAAIQVATINAKSATERSNVELTIAQIRERTEGMKLVHSGEMTTAELNAMLSDKREERAMKSHEKDQDRQSIERVKAVEIAVENQRAQEARADGLPEAAATGKEIG